MLDGFFSEISEGFILAENMQQAVEEYLRVPRFSTNLKIFEEY
jgi:hypothetical protein